MISFNYESNFKLENEIFINNWVQKIILDHGCEEGEINYGGHGCMSSREPSHMSYDEWTYSTCG